MKKTSIDLNKQLKNDIMKKKEVVNMTNKTKKDLEIYDFNALDFIPEDAIEDSVEELEANTEEVLTAPTTHDIEEAIVETLEEE